MALCSGQRCRAVVAADLPEGVAEFTSFRQAPLLDGADDFPGTQGVRRDDQARRDDLAGIAGCLVWTARCDQREGQVEAAERGTAGPRRFR
jgi:hypothetical protein